MPGELVGLNGIVWYACILSTVSMIESNLYEQTVATKSHFAIAILISDVT